MKLGNKAIVITGAAGGIGQALARHFARQKPQLLLLLDIQIEPLQMLASALAPVNVQVGRCDVSDAADINRHVESVLAQVGGIDLFCSNAGVFISGGSDASINDWQRSIQVNALAHVYAANACLPAMLERGSGYFLQTISAAGLLSQIGSAPYSVSKHAALGFAEWLAITYGEQGIGVTALCPQGVTTPMLDNIVDVNSVASDGLLSADEVALCALKAIESRQFLALPHAKVRDYFQRKAADHDKWIKGMQAFQSHLKAL